MTPATPAKTARATSSRATSKRARRPDAVPHAATVLITGATDGLGRGVAGQLAARGMSVLVHGRDEQRGRETLSEIRRGAPDAQLSWYRADLASLAEVRRLAEDVQRDNDRLDALVLNAGIGTATPGGGRRMQSADGYELRFAVNYLAGYLLTRRLLDLLKRSAPARIVSVASAGQAAIDFDDVMLQRRYSGGQAYAQSKLAQIMFTFDLAEELVGTGVTATCLHPGTYMPTKMVTGAGVTPVTSLQDGIGATVRLVVDPALDDVSGRYFNGERPATPHRQALDGGARRRLRELSDRLCGLSNASG
jgi:NAD(P)-dependent dehydrogenase (short-subunit alcohol dehydrogenase family)